LNGLGFIYYACQRNAMIWRATTHEIDLTSRALVMGILNVTADSFSDGGRFLAPGAAVAHALQMADEGAAILDIGGESTRPGAEPVAEEVEMARVLPVVGGILDCGLRVAGGGILLSIDTSKAAVARAAIARGAHIINDVTGLRGDPEMLDAARETGAGLVIMHMRGSPRTMQDAPRYDDVVAEVREFFRQSFERAVHSGIDPMCIAFDPGIGFGKSVAHNLALLKNLAALRVADRPLVLGVSRKSFISRVLGSDSMEDRGAGTVALTALGRALGANVFRVHEVKANAAALRMAEAVLEA
jgi:dihydropteroate synthase